MEGAGELLSGQPHHRHRLGGARLTLRHVHVHQGRRKYHHRNGAAAIYALIQSYYRFLCNATTVLPSHSLMWPFTEKDRQNVQN